MVNGKVRLLVHTSRIPKILSDFKSRSAARWTAEPEDCVVPKYTIQRNANTLHWWELILIDRVHTYMTTYPRSMPHIAPKLSRPTPIDARMLAKRICAICNSLDVRMTGGSREWRYSMPAATSRVNLYFGFALTSEGAILKHQFSAILRSKVFGSSPYQVRRGVCPTRVKMFLIAPLDHAHS